jgi:hypothetical protein
MIPSASEGLDIGADNTRFSGASNSIVAGIGQELVFTVANIIRLLYKDVRVWNPAPERPLTGRVKLTRPAD